MCVSFSLNISSQSNIQIYREFSIWAVIFFHFDSHTCRVFFSVRRCQISSYDHLFVPTHAPFRPSFNNSHWLYSFRDFFCFLCELCFFSLCTRCVCMAKKRAAMTMCRHNVNLQLEFSPTNVNWGSRANVVSDECETTRAHDNHSHPSEWVKCEMRNENDREMMSERWWWELNSELRKHWNSKYTTNDDELGICELYGITFSFFLALTEHFHFIFHVSILNVFSVSCVWREGFFFAFAFSDLSVRVHMILDFHFISHLFLLVLFFQQTHTRTINVRSSFIVNEKIFDPTDEKNGSRRSALTRGVVCGCAELPRAPARREEQPKRRTQRET